MNEYQIVALIAALGSLVLVAGGMRWDRRRWKRGLMLAGVWAGIFAIVILFIDLVR